MGGAAHGLYLHPMPERLCVRRDAACLLVKGAWHPPAGCAPVPGVLPQLRFGTKSEQIPHTLCLWPRRGQSPGQSKPGQGVPSGTLLHPGNALPGGAAGCCWGQGTVP